jgi:hypothetical protein
MYKDVHIAHSLDSIVAPNLIGKLQTVDILRGKIRCFVELLLGSTDRDSIREREHQRLGLINGRIIRC